ALKEMGKQWPGGDTDLKTGLSRAIDSFDQEGRQRLLVYLGDGMSLHNPLTKADRAALARRMVERRITFFPIPLGKQIDAANVHGLATGSGGAVLRVQIF